MSDACGEYVVEWDIELTASDPVEAAHRALAIQRDPEGWATVFHVRIQATGERVRVDLLDEEEPEVEAAAEPSRHAPSTP